MTYHTEFTDYPVADMPATPASFTDTSWHNDVCPSFTSDQLGLTIWIDFADKAVREWPDSVRFCVYPQNHGVEVSGESLETDDWNAVLDFVIARAKAEIAAASMDCTNNRNLDALNDTIEKLFDQRGD